MNWMIGGIAIKKLVCVLLALAMLVLAGCGGNGGEAYVPATETTTEMTTTEHITEEETTEAPEEPTTTAITTTTAAPSPYAPPGNLNQLSQAGQLAYFNLVANRVRRERPGFTQRSRYGQDRPAIHTTGVPRVNPALSEMLNAIMNSLTLDNRPVYHTSARGQDNTGHFLSANANASDLRAQDITGITSERNDAGHWVITVRVAEETNPAPGTGSANARVHVIRSPQDVLDDLMAMEVFSAEVEHVSLRYYDSFVRLTVNAQGQVVAAESGYDMDIHVRDVRIGTGAVSIATDMSITKDVQRRFTSFDWL